MTDTGAPRHYDEFSMFHENAEEFGIPYPCLLYTSRCV